MRTVRGPSQPGLRRLARQALARAVSAGVAETVALSRARGEAIEAEDPGRGPYRRQTGLDWLAGRGRIGTAGHAAGEAYGQAWRRARLEPSIPSSLDMQPGSGGGAGRTASLSRILAHGEGTAMAQQRMAALRARLSHQPDLVAACDAICGEEKTPREAAGGEREAGRLEAVLKVALDLLTGAGR